MMTCKHDWRHRDFWRYERVCMNCRAVEYKVHCIDEWCWLPAYDSPMEESEFLKFVEERQLFEDVPF